MMLGRKGRSHRIRGRRHIRRREVRGSFRNMEATRIMKGKGDKGDIGKVGG
jgi:hypothetical protein